MARKPSRRSKKRRDKKLASKRRAHTKLGIEPLDPRVMLDGSGALSEVLPDDVGTVEMVETDVAATERQLVIGSPSVSVEPPIINVRPPVDVGAPPRVVVVKPPVVVVTPPKVVTNAAKAAELRIAREAIASADVRVAESAVDARALQRSKGFGADQAVVATRLAAGFADTSAASLAAIDGVLKLQTAEKVSLSRTAIAQANTAKKAIQASATQLASLDKAMKVAQATPGKLTKAAQATIRSATSAEAAMATIRGSIDASAGKLQERVAGQLNAATRELAVAREAVAAFNGEPARDLLNAEVRGQVALANAQLQTALSGFQTVATTVRANAKALSLNEAQLVPLSSIVPDLTADVGSFSAAAADVASLDRLAVQVQAAAQSAAQSLTAVQSTFATLTASVSAAEVVDLEVSASVDKETAKIGEKVRWSIAVTNNAETALVDATGIVIEDVLPFGQKLVTDTIVVPEGGSFDTETGRWTVGRPLAPGETATLSFETVVGLAAKADDYVDLELTSKVDKASPLEGDTVEIVYTLTNNSEGATVAATGVSVAASLPAGLTPLKEGGVRASIGSFNPDSGTWNLGEKGSLAAGQSATLTIRATVNADTAGSKINSVAQVATINETDIDSIAGNEAESEDDRTAVSLNVAGVATRNITGRIFLDKSIDGVRNEGESGVAAKISLFDRNNELVATTTASENGTFAFEGVTNDDLRIEFTNWNTSQNISTADAEAANTRSSIAFLKAGSGNAVADLAIYKPADSAEYITSCFVYSGAANLDPAAAAGLIVFNSDGSVRRTVASIAEVGAVNGIGVHRPTGDTFAAAFQRRYADIGPQGNDAIYRVDRAGELSTFINLDDFFGADSAGPYSHTPADWANDDLATDAVGKVAFGDIDVSEDGEHLYAINLHDRRIYKIPVGSEADPLAPVDYASGADPRAGSIERFNVLLDTADTDVGDSSVGIDGADLGLNPEANLRPFALKMHDGLIYVGITNSAQYDASGAQTSIGDPSELQAYVYTFDPATSEFSAEPVLTFGFENLRQSDGYFGNSGVTPIDTEWHSWQETYLNRRRHQPWLTDIEFDNNGDMIVGIRDRLEDQSSSGEFGPGDQVFSAGDILRALPTEAGGWQIEEHVTNPDVGEYYSADKFNGRNTDNPKGHFETAQGGLVQVAGFTGISTTAMDPNQFRSGGIRTIDNADGETVDASIELFLRANPEFEGFTPGSFEKANGLGDLEYTNNLQIEIGNRIWVDADQDGQQDAGEDAVADVTLNLYDMSDPESPVLVGTTTTDANGEYYFNDSNVSYSDGGVVTGLRALTDYQIRVAEDEFQSGGELQKYNVTQQDVETTVATGNETVSGDAEFDPNNTGALDTARNQRIDVLASNETNSDGKRVVITAANGGTATVDHNGTVIFEFAPGSVSGDFDYEKAKRSSSRCTSPTTMKMRPSRRAT